MADPVTRSKQRTTPLWFLIVATVIGLAAIGLAILGLRISPIIRAKAIQTLEERYQSKVEIADLQVSLFPRVSVTGNGLLFYHHGRRDVPPMIKISRFTAHAHVSELLNKPMHVRELTLEGLELHLPPRKSREEKEQTRRTGPASARTPPNGSAILVIDKIHADGTLLRILPKTPGKDPLEWALKKLQLHSVGRDRPLEFDAVLTNPKPPGLINSKGHFGPWRADEPGDTPVYGHYTFSNADLGVFKGIGGILSSEGDYKGQLNYIQVAGATDTPDFVVRTGQHRVHLTTRFQAVVDGTDGDTYLQPVEAHFLRSTLICRGSVEGKPGKHGKFIDLDVTMDPGRIEDLLRLATKADEPVIVGNAKLRTKFFLPPGKADVMDRLQLDGRFGIGSGRFTNRRVEGKVTELSARAQGKPEAAEELLESGGVASDLKARFMLKDAVATFPSISFAVPGAIVQLHGFYNLETEKMNFEGKLIMQAKVSEAVTGWKSWLLKAVDPFFAKHGHGAEIPIHISGARTHPDFGVDLFRKEDKKKK
jgi:hypothetical protein